MGEQKGDESEPTSENEMPVPADLAPIFQAHNDKLKKAYVESSKAFEVFKQRDQKIAELTDAYQQEIVKVFTIAKAVTTPPAAIASVPIVLAAANEAFAKAPLTEQAVTASIEDVFGPFKS